MIQKNATILHRVYDTIYILKRLIFIFEFKLFYFWYDKNVFESGGEKILLERMIEREEGGIERGPFKSEPCYYAVTM